MSETMTPDATNPDATNPGGSEAAATGGAKSRRCRRVLQGRVISSKMDKTVTVEISRRVKHPVYEKFVNRRTRVHAHDENNEAGIGDIVQVSETRPLSKLKRFRLVKILTRAVRD